MSDNDERSLVDEYFGGGSEPADAQAEVGEWDEGDVYDEPDVRAPETDSQFVARHVQQAAQADAETTQGDVSDEYGGDYYEAGEYADAGEYDAQHDVVPADEPNPQLAAALEQFARDDPAGYAELARTAGVDVPPPPTAEEQISSRIAAETAYTLQALNEIERSRSDRETQAGLQAQQEQVAALQDAHGHAHELATEAMAKHDMRSTDPADVMAVADLVLQQYDPAALDGLDEWQSEQLAGEVLTQAAGLVKDRLISDSVLDKYFPRRRT